MRSGQPCRAIACVLTSAIAVSVAVVFAGAILLFAAYESSEHGAAQVARAETTTVSLAAMITPLLWDFETDRARLLIDEAARAPDILSIRVFDENGDVLLESAADDQIASSEITCVRSLVFEDAFVTRTIGRIEVVGVGSTFWETTFARLRLYGVLFVVITILATVITRRSVSIVVNQPIDDLKRAIDETRLIGVPQRAETRSTTEFRELIDGYNELADALRASQEENQRRLRELTEANAAKLRFLSVMSHELRTPLNGVLGMAQLLKMANLAEQERGFVETIIGSGKSLLDLVNDVLDASTIEIGEMSLQEEMFDLAEVAEQAICVARGVAALKGVDVRLDVDLGDNLQRIGDPRRLSQIITNLLGNAVKFTACGEVRLRILELDAASVRIEVSDTGPGVPFDKQEVIFERFRQADEETSRAFGGSGLGLAICRDLVQLMGGSIGVVSEPGDGALFWIELPLPRATSELCATSRHDAGRRPGDADEKPLDASAVEPSANADRPIVVIAEDDPNSRAVLATVLRDAGCEVVEASNGAEALERIRAGDVSLSILDIVMPVMRGDDAIVEIRSLDGDAAKTPIIAVSGLSDADAAGGLRRRGADFFVSKPVDDARLLELSLSALRLGATRGRLVVSNSPTEH